MGAILRRELGAYFASPIGYIVLSVFYGFSGIFFFAMCLSSNSSDLSPVFGSLLTLVLFLIPILTMRLLSEDKRQKTDQALLTAPISLTGLVMGKFLAALAVFFLGLCVMLVYAAVIAVFTPPDWPIILGNFAGMLLLGSALISIGLFFSSLAENQVIAAILGMFTALALFLVDAFSSVITQPLLYKIVTGISFFSRYNDFTVGKFDLANVVFFLSVCALFIFLTVRVLEKRRWS